MFYLKNEKLSPWASAVEISFLHTKVCGNTPFTYDLRVFGLYYFCIQKSFKRTFKPGFLLQNYSEFVSSCCGFIMVIVLIKNHKKNLDSTMFLKAWNYEDSDNTCHHTFYVLIFVLIRVFILSIFLLNSTILIILLCS